MCYAAEGCDYNVCWRHSDSCLWYSLPSSEKRKLLWRGSISTKINHRQGGDKMKQKMVSVWLRIIEPFMAICGICLFAWKPSLSLFYCGEKVLNNQGTHIDDAFMWAIGRSFMSLVGLFIVSCPVIIVVAIFTIMEYGVTYETSWLIALSIFVTIPLCAAFFPYIRGMLKFISWKK